MVKTANLRYLPTKLYMCCFYYRASICNAGLSTSATNAQRDPTQIKTELAFLTPEEIEQKRKLQEGYITLETPVSSNFIHIIKNHSHELIVGRRLSDKLYS